ncbi:MAG: dTMP kinase [Endomicrobium sp.]|jgi:dTMP kinase|nr:dTMP kinase [Endomicrobium sp.]
MRKQKTLFITVEGGEGSGKTTHSNLLKDYLAKSGFSVLLTREPGGTALAEALRKILLTPNSNLTPLSELLLYEAARAQHIQEIILPALKDGKAVVCDRFTDATLAYQGYGRGLSASLISKLNGAASYAIKPTLTFYLDIDPKLGLKKAKSLDKESYGKDGDRIERESRAFHQRVREGYLAQAKKEPKRIKIIKTDKNIAKTWNLIEKELEKCLKKF